MPSAGFKLMIPVIEQLKTYAFDRTATTIGTLLLKKVKCTLVQALRLCAGRTAHRGSRGIALLLHDQRH